MYDYLAFALRSAIITRTNIDTFLFRFILDLGILSFSLNQFYLTHPISITKSTPMGDRPTGSFSDGYRNGGTDHMNS